MKTYHYLILTSALIIAGCSGEKETALSPVNFSQVEIQDAFWTPVLKRHKDVTMNVCIDQIENKTGRIKNFENAAKKEGEHSGIFFDDSDVYKALEGMAYSLKNNPDPELEAKCDEWIAKFAAAQQEDGYINTFYTLTGLDKRWSDMDKHEMYCAGHMTEAAIAYYDATGKRTLLDVSEKMAAHMMDQFGPDKRHWVPGHEEIELALVKLYKVTGKKEYLDFAQWLIDERGHGYAQYIWENPPYAQYQDEVPVRELQKITGHAVRAMYLFCGMADIASYTKDTGYMKAMERVWDNIVDCKMYVTGGIGHIGHGEGFSADYDLPNKEAYCETCASIGMVLWNWRMNSMTSDAKYIDVMERSLYNGVMSGISLGGDLFFYVNPLESDGNHHRKAWYGCACCPSNLCRFIPSIGNYLYQTCEDSIYVNLYAGNRTKIGDLVLEEKTGYPWTGDISITVCDNTDKTFKLRIPGWCDSWTATVNGEPFTGDIEKGYLTIGRKWQKGDVIELNLDMPAKLVKADDNVVADLGKRAVQRGPIVFCLEGVDNAESYEKASLVPDCEFAIAQDNVFPEGTVNLQTGTLHFIPYYAWDNREATPMKVWIDFAE